VRILPEHVVIIPDGNRRWAKKNGLVKTAGHVKSGTYANLNSLMQEAKKLGVKTLSFWGFSTENWKRSKMEVGEIMGLISKGVKKCLIETEKDKARFIHIGRKDRLPKELIEDLDKLEKKTEKFDELYVLLCLDYGGRDEILRAAEKMKIEGKPFEECLDTYGLPDPDLMIRTGGEKRLSGFMPFQSGYAELYFTDVYFPDFSPKHLREAVKDFSNRKRNFGK